MAAIESDKTPRLKSTAKHRMGDSKGCSEGKVDSSGAAAAKGTKVANGGKVAKKGKVVNGEKVSGRNNADVEKDADGTKIANGVNTSNGRNTTNGGNAAHEEDDVDGAKVGNLTSNGNAANNENFANGENCANGGNAANLRNAPNGGNAANKECDANKAKEFDGVEEDNGAESGDKLKSVKDVIDKINSGKSDIMDHVDLIVRCKIRPENAHILKDSIQAEDIGKNVGNLDMLLARPKLKFWELSAGHGLPVKELYNMKSLEDILCWLGRHGVKEWTYKSLYLWNLLTLPHRVRSDWLLHEDLPRLCEDEVRNVRQLVVWVHHNELSIERNYDTEFRIPGVTSSGQVSGQAEVWCRMRRKLHRQFKVPTNSEALDKSVWDILEKEGIERPPPKEKPSPKKGKIAQRPSKDGDQTANNVVDESAIAQGDVTEEKEIESSELEKRLSEVETRVLEERKEKNRNWGTLRKKRKGKKHKSVAAEDNFIEC